MPNNGIIDPESICKDVLIPLVRKVGQFIKENAGVPEEKIESKDLNSLVSYVDKEAERMLVEGLDLPNFEFGFITEEGNTRDEENGLVWVIDPLDGTTNFLHQLPFYSVSVALYQNKRPLVAVVYEVNRDEMFYAWSDGGAYLNSARIHVSTRELKNGLVATGLPYTTFDYEEEYHTILRKATHNSRGIRRFGSAALDLAYVACGRFDVYFEYMLNLYDIAAGVLLVQEAGGIVTDMKGDKEGWYSAWSVLAGNPVSHTQFIKLIEP